MSQQQPEPREKVDVDVREFEIEKTTWGDSRTFMRFWVKDYEWRGVYLFLEDLSLAAQTRFSMASGGQQAVWVPHFAPPIDLGRPLTSVYPATPLRVDQFVLPPGPSPATLRKHHAGRTTLDLRLRLQVATGNWEEIPLLINSKKPRELPAAIETGWVHLVRVE